MKTVCYFITQNLYRDVFPSLKSLLKNGGIDRVYIFAEDDDIGFDLPEKVIVQNVEPWKKLLDPNGPNYNCRWTYMVMMKVALCEMLHKVDKALTLDVDTIVRGDISGLWDIDLTDYYFAGVREPYWYRRLHREYVNAGVLLWNLNKMRDGTAQNVIRAMNRKPFIFVEQEALNEMCFDGIKTIDGRYNAGDWTEKTTEPVLIRHLMASHGAWVNDFEVNMYREMPWEEVFG